MAKIVPDLEWYLALSERKSVQPRCPFATVRACPRFYQSLSLLGSAGSTSIDPTEDERLLETWKTSDLWPQTAEQETEIAGSEETYSSFSKFCPEVTFERWGYFASNLHSHVDEIDRDHAHARLSESEASPGHWGWAWALVAPMHYTECPLYSPLAHRSTASRADEGESSRGTVIPDTKESYVKRIEREIRDLASLFRRNWILAVVVLVCFLGFGWHKFVGFPASGSADETKLVSEILSQAKAYRELVAQHQQDIQELQGAESADDDARMARMERELSEARLELARRADTLESRMRIDPSTYGGIARESPSSVVEAWTACVESAGAGAAACDQVLQQGLGSDP